MKTILFSILILFSINGFAFNWKKVGKDVEGNSYYVDASNIKKHNGLVYYWSLNDFLEPVTGPLGNINSVIYKFKTNCEEEKQTGLNGTFYSQLMGKGRILYEHSANEIEYPKPNEVRYLVMKFACYYSK